MRHGHVTRGAGVPIDDQEPDIAHPGCRPRPALRLDRPWSIGRGVLGL